MSTLYTPLPLPEGRENFYYRVEISRNPLLSQFRRFLNIKEFRKNAEFISLDGVIDHCDEEGNLVLTAGISSLYGKLYCDKIGPWINPETNNRVFIDPETNLYPVGSITRYQYLMNLSRIVLPISQEAMEYSFIERADLAGEFNNNLVWRPI